MQILNLIFLLMALPAYICLKMGLLQLLLKCQTIDAKIYNVLKGGTHTYTNALHWRWNRQNHIKWSQWKYPENMSEKSKATTNAPPLSPPKINTISLTVLLLKGTRNVFWSAWGPNKLPLKQKSYCSLFQWYIAVLLTL